MQIASESTNLYSDSWKIYREHSQVFTDDLEYYANFVQGHRSLELFAGYGRVTNYLVKQNIPIDAMDLSPELVDFIDLPEGKKRVGDVLTFKVDAPYERVFAAYNSFCLLVSDSEVERFFSNLSSMLSPRGRASLNYYDTNYWPDAVAYSFDFEGKEIEYFPDYDLSAKDAGRGRWTDRYKGDGIDFQHDYDVRVYNSSKDLLPFLEHTDLVLVEEVQNFRCSQVMEPGWVDFILEKRL